MTAPETLFDLPGAPSPGPLVTFTTPRNDQALLQRCPKCTAFVLRAFVEALDIRADPTPLDPGAELAALSRGLLTLDAESTRYPPGYRLAYRNASRIAAGRRHIVLAQHQCRTPTEGNKK